MLKYLSEIGGHTTKPDLFILRLDDLDQWLWLNSLEWMEQQLLVILPYQGFSNDHAQLFVSKKVKTVFYTPSSGSVVCPWNCPGISVSLELLELVSLELQSNLYGMRDKVVIQVDYSKIEHN